MGLFDKLKSVGNMLTGGAAEVFVEVQEDASVESPFAIRVKAMLKDQDLKIDKVYLKIRAVETVRIDDVPVARRSGDEIYLDNEDITRSYTTYKVEVPVAGPQTLEAGQEYEWEVEIDLKDNAAPTYYGHFAKHEWSVFAGLDAFGNDPDSGWVTIELY